MRSIQPEKSRESWLRFFARYIDYALFGEFVWALVVPLFPLDFEINPAGANLLIVFAWIFVESLLLMTFNTTPGKAILAIDVVSQDNQPVSSVRFLSRSFGVWLKGVGIGFPIATLFTMYFSWKKLDQTGSCAWDSKNGLVIRSRPISMLRGTLATIVILVLTASKIIGIIASKN